MDPESPAEDEPARQPYLFNLNSCVAAPSVVLSRSDGQVTGEGVEGWLCQDRRHLSRLRVTVGGREPVGLAEEQCGAAGARFRAVVPDLGDRTDDPTVLATRGRTVDHQELVETVTIRSAARSPTPVVLAVAAGADLSPMADVRRGRPLPEVTGRAHGAGLSWSRGDDATSLEAEPAPDEVVAGAGRLVWRRTLGPGEALTVRLRAIARPGRPRPFAGATTAPWSRPEVRSPDFRLAALVDRGFDDLAGLLLHDEAAAVGPDARGDAFVAAGAPWFLTLFGRDSLTTARMLLPFGTDLALSTLRALARRQGTREDPVTAEQLGRIPHEVRGEPLVLQHVTLPPTYYGTADATQLFVLCCAEAWRWGADPAQVQDLLPAVERGLAWMEQQTQSGFLSYLDTTGGGLSNQGWKDSVDSIQWADGRLAQPPIALSEVQAYSHQAAVLGADLLDAFDRPGAGHWRAWAADLRQRFADAFWVEDEHGRFPAVALDANGSAVDSVASNMGHLLGTGILEREDAALVAQRLTSPGMSSGFGLRTLDAGSPRSSPLSYHGGAVWPHDTAVAVAGLAREGFAKEAWVLLRGLLRAAPSVGFRMPELYGGDDAAEVSGPTPYPAACRPQAWSAAAPVAALVALLGLDVDVPGGTVVVRPEIPDVLRPLTVRGLRVGDHHLHLSVHPDGTADVETDHPAAAVRTGEEAR